MFECFCAGDVRCGRCTTNTLSTNIFVQYAFSFVRNPKPVLNKVSAFLLKNRDYLVNKLLNMICPLPLFLLFNLAFEAPEQSRQRVFVEKNEKNQVNICTLAIDFVLLIHIIDINELIDGTKHLLDIILDFW